MNIEGCVALVTVPTEVLAGPMPMSCSRTQPQRFMQPRAPGRHLRCPADADLSRRHIADRHCGGGQSMPGREPVINNAGVMLKSPMLAEGSENALRREMEVNVYGVLAMVRAFAPILARNGGGAIVNMQIAQEQGAGPWSA